MAATATATATLTWWQCRLQQVRQLDLLQPKLAAECERGEESECHVALD